MGFLNLELADDIDVEGVEHKLAALVEVLILQLDILCQLFFELFS